MAIVNDQIDAVEDTTLQVDAADGVLANDSAPNGPLSVAEEFDLIRTAAGGLIAFDADGSYKYVSAPGFSGIDSAQYTVLDSSSNVVGTGTLTINVAATAHVPFVSVGSPISDRHVVTAGFNQIGNGIATSAFAPTVLSGGGYVVPVDYLDHANGSIIRIFTYDANHNLVGTFDPPTRVFGLKVAPLANGSYAAVWDTGVFSLGERIVHVQVFDASGTPLTQSTIDLPAVNDLSVRIAPLPGGGFVVVHQGAPGDMYARPFDAAGVPESQSFAIGTPGQTRAPTVLPNGQIVTTTPVDDDGIHIRRYDTHGNPIGVEIVAPNGDDEGIENTLLVTPLRDGRFAVSWASYLPGGGPHAPVPTRSHVQIVDANGELVGTPVTSDLEFSTLFGAPKATVTALANGGFTVTWRGIYIPDLVDEIQAYDASGNPVGSPITFDAVSAFGSSRALVYGFPAGGFAIGIQGANPDHHNLRIYDNNANKVGEVRMQDPGSLVDTNTPFLATLPNGDTLVLFDLFVGSLVTSRITAQTADFGSSPTPLAETGMTFDTTATFPVAISIPDPDGSEFVTSFDISGVPAGWTLSAPAGIATLNGGVWTVTSLGVEHGGTTGLVLTPNAPVNASVTINVVAHAVDTANGSVSQSIAVPLTVNLQTGTATTGTSGDDSYTASDSQRFDGLGGTDTITFGFKLVDANISFSGNQVIVDGPGGSHTVLTGFEIFQFTDGTVNNNDGDRLVDDMFYYSHNHDVWNAHTDADAHFHTLGWHQSRDPSPFFSISTYLSLYPDVKAAGADPLTHFDQPGWKEGRAPSIDFDPVAYLAANPDVKAAGVDPLRHYLEFGYQEGRQPVPFKHLLALNGFDYVYYLQNNPDVAAAHVDPLQHFQAFGWKEGRNPNALFDVNGYLNTYADVKAAGVNPLDHFNQFGWHEGRDPSVYFDNASYVGNYADIAGAQVNPLNHFLAFGLPEGRSAFADYLWG